MDATTIVAVAGILGTLVGALAGPYVAGRLDARNAAAARRFELLVEACAEGMAYLNGARTHIESFFSPDTWPARGNLRPAKHSTITSRLDLLGTPDLTQQWHAFTDVYWALFANHMTTEMGNEPVVVDYDNPAVQHTFEKVDRAGEALREAAGTATRPPRISTPRWLAARRARRQLPSGPSPA